jgi:hypothetical protein
MGVGGKCHDPTAFPPGERPGTHCIREWVGPRAGPGARGNSYSARTRSPDSEARSQSLYHLSYPYPFVSTDLHKMP